MKLTKRQETLLQFIKEQHEGQLRKYSLEPYWMHPYEVSTIVNKYEKTPCAIEIALCHDLLEDTKCTPSQLSNFLAHNEYSISEAINITSGTIELTDKYTKETHPELNRRERKKAEAIRMGKISSLAQTVKYADLIHNTQSIIKYDKNFAKTYLNEKKELLNEMRNGNIDLLILCCYTLLYAFNELNKDK
jgi:guanosine-3',5'-bis(diphosphate) 3'-pyrophosphohydrolase